MGPQIAVDYLRFMGKNLPPEITIVWTGSEVSSYGMSEKDVACYARLVNRNRLRERLCYWDNIPWDETKTPDPSRVPGCKGKLNFRPYRSLSKKFSCVS